MRRFRINIRIAAILVAAAIGAALTPARTTALTAPREISSIWPAMGHDRAHTGRSQFETSANPGQQKWRFATGGSVASPAVGTDGTI